MEALGESVLIIQTLRLLIHGLYPKHLRSSFLFQYPPTNRVIDAPQVLLQMSHGETKDEFLQEFISNPFLIDGFKVDINVFVIIASVQPLRVYMLNGTV